MAAAPALVLLPLSSVTAAQTVVGTPSNTDVAAQPTGFRIVEHALGVTKVPANVRRLVVFSTQLLDAALTLGVTPIAAATVQVDGQFPSYLADRTGGIEPLGQETGEQDLERVIVLDPDLMLVEMRDGQVGFIGVTWETLSQIAPTVPFGLTETEEESWNWRVTTEKLAAVLSRADELDKAKAAYDARVNHVREAIGGSFRNLTVSFLRVEPDNLRLYSTFAAQVLTDVGFELFDAGSACEEIYPGICNTSNERLHQLVGDAVFVFSTEPDGIDRLTSNPLWSVLPAVQENRAYIVDASHWLLGSGYQAAFAILDDIERLFGQG